jgi:ABC-2 type transport system permease protein
MILPVAIPVSIAAYSVVGEKTARSLEPLLATPITTLELLLGKALAAVTPAVTATWLGYAIYVVGVRLLVNDVVFSYMLQPLWFIAIGVVSPLLALMAVSFGLMVSSRVSDPRVAEQVSAVVILPLVLFIVGQSVGLILIDQRTIILMAIVVALIDIILIYFTVKLFQRETILTRWKCVREGAKGQGSGGEERGEWRENWAGESVDSVKKEQTAAEIIHELTSEAEAPLGRWH